MSQQQVHQERWASGAVQGFCALKKDLRAGVGRQGQSSNAEHRCLVCKECVVCVLAVLRQECNVCVSMLLHCMPSRVSTP